MKKYFISIFLFLFSIFLLTISVRGETLKKIHMNLNEKQIAITFLNSENMKALLVSSKKEDFIILLEGIGNLDFKKELAFFQYDEIDTLVVTEEIPLLEQDKFHFQVYEEEYETSNIEVKTSYEKTIISYFNHKFCVATRKDQDLDECNYIYLLDPTLNQEFSEEIKVVIYDEGVQEETILKNYNNWIDTVKLSGENYISFLFTPDTYEMVRIPKKTAS